MGTKHTQQGFTIVEVMLVLAVTGLMLIGIFAGASVQISVQRYRDSVTSYQSYLKDQYSQTLYSSNERDGNQSCNQNAAVVEGATARGASNCLVIGRYVTTSDGQNFQSQTILASLATNSPADPTVSDLEDLQRYSFGLAGDIEDYQLNWDSKLSASGVAGPGDMAFTLAMIRSPVSGSIMTFKVDRANSQVKNTESANNGLVGNPLKNNFDMCVKNGAGGVMASPLAVRIDAGAATGSAVEIPPESERVCS